VVVVGGRRGRKEDRTPGPQEREEEEKGTKKKEGLTWAFGFLSIKRIC